MKKKILVTVNIPREGLVELEERFDVIYPDSGSFTVEEINHHMKSVDGVLEVFTRRLKSEIIESAKNLKVIANYGVGFNNIDVKKATECGVFVTNTPISVAIPTAEMALGLIFSLLKRITEMDRALRASPTENWGMMESLGSDIQNKKLGIIGMGRIGYHLAERAAACGMEIFYHNRTRVSEEKEKIATYMELDQLLKECDVISLNCPLTPETKGLIGAEQFAMMKDGAAIINTARGPVVDEQALVKALESGKLSGAGLDVFDREPKITDQLLELPNVICTPHKASGTVEARASTAEEAAQNIIKFFDGDLKTMNIVNPELLDE